jgi:hypothetical protein
VRLKPLYRLTFSYPQGWSVAISGDQGTQSQHLFFAEGRCTGLINGTFKGANYPQTRTDGTFVPDFNGVIETDDGAVILKRTAGYGRAYPVGRRQIVASEIHLSDDERYKWLNDTVCMSTGEVRTLTGDSESGDGSAIQMSVELVVDVAELVWEELPDVYPPPQG